MSEKRKNGDDGDEQNAATATAAKSAKVWTPAIDSRLRQPKKLITSWQKQNPLHEDRVRLLSKPFKLAVVQDFLADASLIPDLVAEMNDLSWTRRQMDLYEFHQSDDLINLEEVSLLRRFRDFLQEKVRPWIQEVTGLELTHVSASASMYNVGDHLLTHDDMLSDRKIAYVFYVSPWLETWTESMGGALELFRSLPGGKPYFPPVERIAPRNNQFVFFQVSPSSFHQVGEVTTFEYPRLTINGWFHGPGEIDGENETPWLLLELLDPTDGELNLEQYINDYYFDTQIKSDIQKTIEESSEMALEDFFKDTFVKELSNDIKTLSSLRWRSQKPANLRFYDALIPETASGRVKQLLNIFTSSKFFTLLHEYTELDLAGEKAFYPRCSVELQRWKGGSYTVLGDPSAFADSALDLVFYINAAPNVGVITYLAPDEDQQEPGTSTDGDGDPALLTIHPKNNTLNIVYRSEGTAKFTKYVSKRTPMEEEFCYILVCSYKE